MFIQGHWKGNYFETYKARMWVAIFGREGARWALGILGVVIVGLALFAKF